MKYLIDTHILIWWVGSPENLTSLEKKTIENPRNHIYVSAATAWEIAIKTSLGKLKLPGLLTEALKNNSFLPLPISIEHALHTENLPHHHNDPFDRLLVAQCMLGGFTLITRDAQVKKYDISILA